VEKPGFLEVEGLATTPNLRPMQAASKSKVLKSPKT